MLNSYGVKKVYPINIKFEKNENTRIFKMKIEQIEDKQYLVLLGRKKNLIILGNGENVSPEELESIFIKHSEIKDCMVKEMDFNSTKVIGIEILPESEQFTSENNTEIEKKLREIIDLENTQLPTYKQKSNKNSCKKK